MNGLWKIFIFILLINYSYERPINQWSITNDSSLIDECLKKSLKHINLRQDTIKTALTDVKNLICQTQINDGISIQLTFTLEEQTWQCILYKSVVQTLSIEYEKCDRIETENQGKLDEINQNKQEQDLKQTVDNKPDCQTKTDNQKEFDMHANRNSDEEY